MCGDKIHQGGAGVIFTTLKKSGGIFDLKYQEDFNKSEKQYKLEFENVIVEIQYSENNKSFNTCMLNILRQKKST